MVSINISEKDTIDALIEERIDLRREVLMQKDDGYYIVDTRYNNSISKILEKEEYDYIQKLIECKELLKQLLR